MKRRLFVKKFGQGLSSSMFLPGIAGSKLSKSTSFEFQYPYPEQLEDATNDEGHVAVRLVISGASKNYEDRLKGRIKSKKCNIHRIKTYFNSGYNEIDLQKYTFDLSAWEGDHHIITIWLEEISGGSELVCNLNKKNVTISLGNLLPNNEFEYQGGSHIIRANLLFHNEVGSINPEDVKIPADKDNYRFIIMADPQGGGSKYRKSWKQLQDEDPQCFY